MSAMRIGVDFDNTIVSYDRVFHQAASERGLLAPNVPTDKEAVRNYLRSAGKENDWIELQGYVYGSRMADANAFPGVADFFRRCMASSIDVWIVSHKTRTPFAGEPYDLHGAARGWLEANGFHDPSAIGLPAERVFFETTKQEKVARIAELKCTHFIDDLPEFLAELGGTGAERVLFDPTGAHPGYSPRFERWDRFADALLVADPRKN